VVKAREKSRGDDMKRWFSSETGLKKKLGKKHLLVVFFGVVFLLLNLSMLYWLKENISMLVNRDLQTSNSTKNIQMNLQKSLASLRAWITVKDQRFIQERKDAWEKGIIPNLKILDRLSTHDGKTKLFLMDTTLKKVLSDLKAWQWHIQDVAQTAGNFPAKVFMNQFWLPTANRLISFSTILINEEKSFSDGRALIFPLADFRGNLTHSVSLMIEYVETGNVSKLVRSQAFFSLAKKAVKKVDYNEKRVRPRQEKILRLLNSRLESYQKLGQQLTALRQKPQTNLAAYWLSKKAVPLARKANNLLNDMSVVQFSYLNSEVRQVELLSSIIPYSTCLFIIFLILYFLWLATFNAKKLLQPIQALSIATKKLAQGELNDNIPIESNDEIGELTRAFNKMREERQLAEVKTRGIVETALEPIVTINEKGIVQSCNSATSNLLGYPAKEILGSNVSMLMPEPHRTQHDSYLSHYLETKTKKIIGQSREVMALSKSGEEIPVLLSVSEIIVGEDRLFTGILRDLRSEKAQAAEMALLNLKLEQKNKEKSLIAELDNDLRGVDDLETFSDRVLAFFSKNFSILLSMFYLVDPRNKVIEMLAGYGYSERRERKTIVQWGDSLVGQCAKMGEPLLIKQVPEEYFRIRTGLGETRPEHVLLLPLMLKQTVLGVLELGSLKPFTKDRQSLFARACYNVSVNLSMIVDKNNFQKLFNETENQRQQLQKQKEEMHSANEELEAQAQALKQSEEEIRSVNDELYQKIDYIEHQKEKIKQKSDDVEKISQYKSEFLANVSHELRTPLNSLLILSQNFMRNRTGNLTQEQQEDAQVIYSSGSDLMNLINDILDISKVESGKLEMCVDKVLLSDVVSSISKQFEMVAQRKGITFSVNCLKKQEISTFDCDEMRLMQILKNLISNAIKFTEHGSVKLDIKTKDDSIFFSVSDTGIGIAKDKQALVFSEFQQADGSTSRKYGGTGLGLSISKKLTDLLGGALTLKSKEGVGSVFTLSLPIENDSLSVDSASDLMVAVEVISVPDDRAKIPQEAKDDRLTLNAEAPSLLVIDDDLRFCQIMAKIAHENAYQLLLALKGETGLMLAAAYSPSAIILDLGLPDMQGDQVLAQLKKDERTSKIPVHIVSGRDQSKGFLKAGALSFIQKPIQQKEITRLLNRISNQENNNILIVEDSKETQKELKYLFSSLEDVTLTFEGSAKGARSRLFSEQYTCIVIDVGLPDQSGLQLIQSLSTEFDVLPPIVIYTARELTPDEHRSISQYANSIVVKGREAPERLFDEVSLFLHHVDERAKHKPLTSKATVPHNKTLKGHTVLLVDDDLRNTFSLSRTLQAEGMKVIIADNGKLAIEKLTAESGIELILMDVMMPVMDGYEAIKKIRKMEGCQDIPIITLTAKATVQDKEQCIKVGANDYMSKPVNVETLLELIRVWLFTPGAHRG
jgi:PAS domain S-box-containing protein